MRLGHELVGIGSFDVIWIQLAHGVAFRKDLVPVLIFGGFGQFFEAVAPFLKGVRRFAHVLIEPLHEALVELLGRHAKSLLDDFRSRLELGVRVHHIQNLVVAPAVFNVIQNLPALIIGNDLLCRVFRANKAAIEIGYRQQFLVANSDKNLRRNTVTPSLSDLRLFVHRQTLGKPTGHPRIRSSKNEDMAHFMP